MDAHGLLSEGVDRARDQFEGWFLLRALFPADRAAFHYETYTAQSGNILYRVSIDSHEISEKAGFHAADGHMKYAACDRCCRTQCVQRRHSVCNHQLQFTC